ncbi:MAG: hypothetical protein LBB77_04760, partial [Treponema sp.]|nr:hypothetical protein [Treponema sp.]
MLITNFAAGELSETLFGRTDLPQYYQGVSFLENFEVIPTGGIERRNGMKRVLKMTGEGRLIPFIISREESFLLYLIPQVGSTKARIQIYRNGVKQGNDLVDSTSVPLPRTMTEIEEVQYAQNYNMMILVHENYAPLRVGVTKGSSGYSISVSKFPVDIKVELSYSEEMTATELKPYDKSDETYSLTGYLRQPDQYPRSVTFFGGRVIFGGTVGNPQRIFASRVNDPYNFSTHKIFLTKQRNYVAVVGKVTADPYVMELASRQDVAKLDENLTDYIPNSPILDGAKIVALRGFKLTLDKPIDLSDSLTEAQRKELEAMVTNFDNYNDSIRNESQYRERFYVALIDNPLYPGDVQYQYRYYVCIGASMLSFILNKYNKSEDYLPESWDIKLPNDAARYATVDYLIGLIRARLN